MRACAGALLLLFAACGEAPVLHGPVRPQAIRPTDGAGWNGNGYGNVRVLFHDTPGGRVRIFYTLEGESAVDPRDVEPADGVPDFVNLVARSADATWDSTITRRGFRPPLDDSIYHDRDDFGGDGRFDIYLRTVGPGGDGYRVTEVCTEVPFTCSGYFVMVPRFAAGHYTSDREGTEVLTSHELFHSIQAAYDARQWPTWAEGTAVWNQTQVFPEGGLRDFLGFLPYFLDEPERPFDKSMGTGPGSLYAYGAALWPQYLGERFGVDIVREIWEGSRATVRGRSPHFLDVTEKVLSRRGTTLAEAWLEFTRWNLLTASRADGTRGYRLAARYPGVRMEPTLRGLGEREVRIDGLSARYLRIEPGLSAPARLRLSLHDESDTPAVGTAYLQPAGGKPTEERPFPSGRIDLEVAPSDAILVVVSGVVRGAPAHPVTVRLAEAPAAPASTAGCTFAPASVGPHALLPLGLLLLRRRRR